MRVDLGFFFTLFSFASIKKIVFFVFFCFCKRILFSSITNLCDKLSNASYISPIYYLRSITTSFCSHMSSLGWFLESLEKYVGPSNYIISFFIKLTINSLLMYFIISLNKITELPNVVKVYIWQLMILNNKDLIKISVSSIIFFFNFKLLK